MVRVILEVEDLVRAEGVDAEDGREVMKMELVFLLPTLINKITLVTDFDVKQSLNMKPMAVFESLMMI